MCNKVKVNGRSLEVVSSAKILGLNVSDDLKWNVHIAELVKKASSRLFSLKQLKRSAVAPSELILFYVTCIRSILEYACPVFHRALPSYLSDDLERLQKRAMKVIYPLLSYTAALKESGLSTLHERREVISLKTFTAIKKTNLTNFTSYFLKTPLDDIVLGTIDLSIFLSVRLNVASQFFNQPYF